MRIIYIVVASTFHALLTAIGVSFFFFFGTANKSKSIVRVSLPVTQSRHSSSTPLPGFLKPTNTQKAYYRLWFVAEYDRPLF